MSIAPGNSPEARTWKNVAAQACLPRGNAPGEGVLRCRVVG